MTPLEPGPDALSAPVPPPRSRRRFRIPPKLQILLIGGVAIGGIVCMGAIVVIIALNR